MIVAGIASVSSLHPGSSIPDCFVGDNLTTNHSNEQIHKGMKEVAKQRLSLSVIFFLLPIGCSCLVHPESELAY